MSAGERADRDAGLRQEVDDAALNAKPLDRPRPLVLYLLGLATVTFWGASFPLTKAALDYTGPTTLAFLRWTISAVFLACWLAIAGRRDREVAPGAAVILLREQWRTAAWVAFVGITLYYSVQNLALRYTTATNAGVLSNFTPMFTVLLGTLLIHERLRGVEWAAVFAAFIGSALVSQGAGHLTLGGTGLIGDALAVVAGLFGAAYSIGGKQLSERYPPVVVTTVVAALGALFLLPLAMLEGLQLDVPLQAWAMVALLGIGSGALANLFWMSLLRYTAASRAALVLFLIPVIAAVLSVVFLGEPITLLLVLGTALVLAGVVVVERGSDRAAHSEP